MYGTVFWRTATSFLTNKLCEPDDRNAICFSGVFAPHVRDVLLKRKSLDEYLAEADRIRCPGA